MKKLGLVGGTGPESTVPYYRGVVHGVNRLLGGRAFPPVVIDSIDVFKVLGFCERHEYDGLSDYVLGSIRNLAAAGADFAALTGNTPHIVFDDLQKRSPIPLASSVAAACEEAGRRKIRRAGLLGTAFTMKEGFFKKPFRESGIEMVIPAEEEREYVHRAISGELELGIVKPETLAAFQEILGRMKKEDGVEAVILGCTELPLLLSDEVSPLPCLDTMAIHIEALIARVMSE